MILKLGQLEISKNFFTLEARILKEVRNHLLPKLFLLDVINVPVNPALKYNKKSIREEYQRKLVINKGIVIPDPLTLKSGWNGEIKGKQNWPSIFYTDIANLLKYRYTFPNTGRRIDTFHASLSGKFTLMN